MNMRFIHPSEEASHDRLMTVGGDGPASNVVASVAIVDDAGTVTRIDILASAGQACFESLRLVDGIAYIGYGSHVFVVNLARNEVHRHRLLCYFGALYDSADIGGLDSRLSVLATSDSEVLAFARSGELLWKRAGVGLDGVVLHEVSDGRLRGDGEWDPPGGWQSFRLCMDSGAALAP